MDNAGALKAEEVDVVVKDNHLKSPMATRSRPQNVSTCL